MAQTIGDGGGSALCHGGAIAAAPVVCALLFCPLPRTQAAEREAPDSGRVYLYNKDFPRAAAWYGARIEARPADIYAHRGYQDACAALGDTAAQGMRQRYRELAGSDSLNPLYLYLYGRCLDCSDGVPVFERALARDGCHALSLNGLGACRFEQGFLDDAARDLNRAIQCDPGCAEAYRNLASVYLAKKQSARAQKVFRRLVAHDRSDPRAFEWLGDFYLRQKQWEYARMAYRKAALLGGRGPSLYFNLGYCCFEMRQFAESAQSYRRSIDEGNTRFEALNNLGTASELADRPEAALEAYQAAFVKSGRASIVYSMGNCAVQLGLYSKAIDCYRRYLASEPRSTEALLGLANAYQMKRDYESATRTYRRILDIDSFFVKAYFNLGSLYAYHLKDVDSMERYWGRYIALSMDRAEAAYIRKEMSKIKASQ